MRLEYTAEQEQLRDEIRATMKEVMTPQRQAAVSERVEGGPAVRECVQALAAADLLGVGWPKEYGGHGFTALEQFIFFEEAQRVNAPIPLVTLNTVPVAVPVVCRTTSPVPSVIAARFESANVTV